VVKSSVQGQVFVTPKQTKSIKLASIILLELAQEFNPETSLYFDPK
jgi:hypothetical protein